MGWLWTCFGGQQQCLCLFQGESRAGQRRKEKSSIQASPLQSLGAHLKSTKEELLQPKQAVSGTLQTKLFKHTSVRRAKSLGNGTPFENGAKRFFDKDAERQETGRLDQLQEEVEVLKKRLAEEEEEARRLRTEVHYLRSCGVIQSPDGHRHSLSLERESLLPKDDKGQRNWQSWLGLSLSPASRFKLEEQLRCMAADELSKVPAKGLTNGQKALIVATKLWQSEGDSSQDYLTKHETFPRNSASGPHGSRLDSSLGHNWPPCEEVPVYNRTSKETPSRDQQLVSKNGEPSYKHQYPSKELTNSTKVLEPKTPLLSASSEPGKFPFQISLLAQGEDTAGHVLAANQPLGELPVPQKVPSSTERRSFGSEIEEMTAKYPVSTAETVRYESPKKTSLHSTPEKVKYTSPTSSSLPSTGTGGRTPEKATYESPKESVSDRSPGTGRQTSDTLVHAQAQRCIYSQYQELEENQLKSPTIARVSLKASPGNSPPRLSDYLQAGLADDSEQDASLISAVAVSSESVQSDPESEASSVADGLSSTSNPSMNLFLAGRMWQPLSPVREVDSGVSSSEDFESTSVTQLDASASVNSSLTSNLKSSIGTVVLGDEGGQQEGVPQEANDMGEVLDDDLFTLSPRRLHHNYNPWVHLDKHAEGTEDECKTVHVEQGSDWAYTEEADLDDFVPIQCQSPAFSPKRNSSRNKLAKEKDFKVEEYARDKYLKDIGLNIEEFHFNSDCPASNKSVTSHLDEAETLEGTNLNTDSPGNGKENNDRIETAPISLGQLLMAGPLKEDSLTPKKPTIAKDITISQELNDYPVLASIENLPKWIECQGVPTSSLDNSESHGPQPDEVLLAQQDSRSDWSTLSCCDSDSGGEVNDDEVEQRPMYQLSKKLRTRHHELEDDVSVSTVEFSIRQDRTSHPASADLESQEEARLRMSLHGFVYRAEHVVNVNPSGQVAGLVQNQDQNHHQNGTKFMTDTLSYPTKQENFVKGVSGDVRLADSAEHQNVEPVDPEERSTSNSQVSTGQQVKFSRGRNDLQKVDEEMKRTPNDDVKHDVLSNVPSLGYSIQIPKLSDSFPGSDDAFDSPGVGGDSEESPASKDGEETFHDCESPTPSESNPERALYSNYETETNSEPSTCSTSKSTNSREEFPSRRMMDISPDDRPILGTVATHWGENSDPKSLREWDGLGIPNSTSKFKEDQRVNWHTTPFETRLEQALSKLPAVPECSQRNLFGGVVM